MSSIGAKWRSFKAVLMTTYVYRKHKGQSPCQKYGIDEDTWSQFVQIREDPSWQVCYTLSRPS